MTVASRAACLAALRVGQWGYFLVGLMVDRLVMPTAVLKVPQTVSTMADLKVARKDLETAAL